MIRRISEIVDFLWIVPSTGNLSGDDFKDWEESFTFLNLTQNFRNSREVVKRIKSFAAEKNYKYKKGIVMPLENFPTGCPPVFVESFEEAMKEARKRTNHGILVIAKDVDDIDIFNQMKEKWKVYHFGRNDFKEEENPYTFLQEGNVLIIDNMKCQGFEWATVIVFEYRGIESANYHTCNFMMRCTTNLIVVR